MSQRISDAALRGYQFDSSDRGQLAADLESLRAAVRRVLEAVVNFAWGPYSEAVLAKELLVNYSNAQRAARAAKEGGAS